MISLRSAPTGDPADYAMNDDAIDLGTQVATHWDALAHVSHGGRIYNGFPVDTVTAEDGATRCGIDKVGPLVTRGVLLDVPRALGVEEPRRCGQPIGPDELDAALAHAGTELEPGDVVLLRTGQARYLHAGDRVRYAFPSPGLTMQAVPWLHERGVAAVAADSLTFEVVPAPGPRAERRALRRPGPRHARPPADADVCRHPAGPELRPRGAGRRRRRPTGGPRACCRPRRNPSSGASAARSRRWRSDEATATPSPTDSSATPTGSTTATSRRSGACSPPTRTSTTPPAAALPVHATRSSTGSSRACRWSGRPSTW